MTTIDRNANHNMQMHQLMDPPFCGLQYMALPSPWYRVASGGRPRSHEISDVNLGPWHGRRGARS